MREHTEPFGKEYSVWRCKRCMRLFSSNWRSQAKMDQHYADTGHGSYRIVLTRVK